MVKVYNWQERRELRVKLIVFGLIAWGMGCLLTFFLRDRNWMWGCYTFELCLLWPYKSGSAIETVSIALAVVGEALFWVGLLMGNRGEGRLARAHQVEGMTKVVLGLALDGFYLWLLVWLVLPGALGASLEVMIWAILLGIGYAVEAILGVALIIQGIKCLKLARKAPKVEQRQGRVYYRAK